MFGVTSSSTASSCRGKSGNAEIVGGGNPHQSGSSPKDRYIQLMFTASFFVSSIIQYQFFMYSLCFSSPSATRELRSSRVSVKVFFFLKLSQI